MFAIKVIRSILVLILSVNNSLYLLEYVHSTAKAELNFHLFYTLFYLFLYNNQINARALIGQSAVGYCAGKPTEKSRVFWIII